MGATTEGAPAGGPERRWLWAAIALGLALRVGFLLLEPATHPVADERTWTDWAVRNLATPKVGLSPLRTHMIFYPPLYPYFIALPWLAFGSLAAVQWLQVLVSVLLVPAVAAVGSRALSPRAGLGAALLCAAYPELVWFSVHFWSETLFLVLLWWALAWVLAADDDGRPRSAAIAGVLWGLAILTRETVLYFTPLLAAWMAFRAPRAGGGRRGAAYLLAAALVVAPWTLRNWIVFHAFVPVSTAGGQNLFQGNTRIPRDETYRMVDAVSGRIEQYRYARRMGLEAIRERQPLWAFEKLVEQMPHFWEADSLALIHIKRGAYGEVSPARARAAAVVVLTPYLLVLPPFVAGLALALAWPERRRTLLAVFLIYYNALHVITHGFARYRLPVMPVVFLLAAWVAGLLADRAARAAAPPHPRALLAVCLALAVALGLSLFPSLRRDLAHPAYGLSLGAGGEADEE